VKEACRRAGIAATFWEGSFGGFAALIAASSLYVGYDSAGQHVRGRRRPLISIFAGFPPAHVRPLRPPRPPPRHPR